MTYWNPQQILPGRIILNVEGSPILLQGLSVGLLPLSHTTVWL